MSLACVLVSDVTDSTGLFERLDTAAALARIDAMLARMRDLVEAAGGHCVKAKGDDILSFFPDADASFRAAWAMANEDWSEELTIHAGGCFGEILSHANDIYGNAVNTAARLAELAKPGEILFADSCFTRLGPNHRDRFVAIGALPLRGKEAPTEVYSCARSSLDTQTTVKRGSAATQGAVFAAFSHRDAHWHLEEGRRLTVGRADSNDIVIDHPSVSRNHAALEIHSGQLEFTDHSSGGSLVALADGQKIAVHRRTTLLSGAGVLQVGTPETATLNIAFSVGMLKRR